MASDQLWLSHLATMLVVQEQCIPNVFVAVLCHHMVLAVDHHVSFLTYIFLPAHIMSYYGTGLVPGSFLLSGPFWMLTLQNYLPCTWTVRSTNPRDSHLMPQQGCGGAVHRVS